MILTTLMFFVALCLSAVAAFYSIVGLTAIFAAAVMPIILMGSILEVAKLTVTVWLHEYWDRARWLMKVYLSTAVVVLMIITSMGIFGFLSKAHSDQGMVSGDVLAKISIYDEKIKTEKENIEANRKALKQMDEGVDQVLGRSTDEKGADKAVALRRAQQKERVRLQNEISQSQKSIAELNDARAPIAAEVRKVEAEVGPIKYIAALIYGDNPDTNLLEKAVRWVIILLVIVFDPLAVMMLLAATESRKWNKNDKIAPAYEPDDGPLTDDQMEQLRESVNAFNLPTGDTISKDELFPSDPSPPGWMYTTTRTYPSTEEEVEELTTEFDRSKHAYLDKPFVNFENLKPMVYKPEAVDVINNEESEDHKEAKRAWKKDHPELTIKEQQRLFDVGRISHLPWDDYLPQQGFGRILPATANKGDFFIKVGMQPTELFKFNGKTWISVNKNNTDQYLSNSEYIDFLIKSISAGEYDPDLLTAGEQQEIENKLRKDV
jgi:hypothetical protein